MGSCMRKPLLMLIPVAVAAVGLVWRGVGLRPQGEHETAAAIAWRHGPPTTILVDGNEIFTKALWRRPTPSDQIRHAERHEWRDADGLERWQWFLVVSASPGLIKYLRDDNVFGLLPVSSIPVVPEAPPWFRYQPEEVTILQANHGGMRLMFSKSDNTLYATASGRGFTKGAPEPPPATQGAQTPGRIPATPPPGP